VKQWMGEEAWELLGKEFYGRLGISVGDQPYIVPVNYVLDGKKIYIHSANKGRKLDAIRANPKVCFEVSEPEKLVKGEKPCQFGVRYWSVLAFGDAAVVEDPEEKLSALELLGRKYGGDDIPCTIGPEDVPRVTVVKVSIKEISGKRNVDNRNQG